MPSLSEHACEPCGFFGDQQPATRFKAAHGDTFVCDYHDESPREIAEQVIEDALGPSGLYITTEAERFMARALVEIDEVLRRPPTDFGGDRFAECALVEIASILSGTAAEEERG